MNFVQSNKRKHAFFANTNEAYPLENENEKSIKPVNKLRCMNDVCGDRTHEDIVTWDNFSQATPDQAHHHNITIIELKET